MAVGRQFKDWNFFTNRKKVSSLKVDKDPWKVSHQLYGVEREWQGLLHETSSSPHQERWISKSNMTLQHNNNNKISSKRNEGNNDNSKNEFQNHLHYTWMYLQMTSGDIG